MYKRFFKRFFDIVLSGLALVVLSPLFLVVAILVRIKLGSPVIFKQKRAGLNNKIFNIYKFRSMTNQKDKNGNLLPDEQRLTKFGKWLRATSLDELPQLWNIFKGDMSIIGPRPKLVYDIVFLDETQSRRSKVRPGLTGLAQVNGRNAIDWEQVLKYDLEYIDKISFFTDLKIFFKTVKILFKREGINAPGMATHENFGEYLLRTGKINEKNFEQKNAVADEMIKKAG